MFLLKFRRVLLSFLEIFLYLFYLESLVPVSCATLTFNFFNTCCGLLANFGCGDDVVRALVLNFMFRDSYGKWIILGQRY